MKTTEWSVTGEFSHYYFIRISSTSSTLSLNRILKDNHLSLTEQTSFVFHISPRLKLKHRVVSMFTLFSLSKNFRILLPTHSTILAFPPYPIPGTIMSVEGEQRPRENEIGVRDKKKGTYSRPLTFLNQTYLRRPTSRLQSVSSQHLGPLPKYPA